MKSPKNSNEGRNLRLEVARLGQTRALVAFDFTGIDLARLLKATLVLTIAGEATHNWGEEGRAVIVQRLLVPWEEGNGWLSGSESPDRGSGPGVNWNCPADPEIGDKRLGCKPRWVGGDRGAAPPSAPGTVHTRGLTGEVSWEVTEDVLAGAENGWLIRKERPGRWGDVAYHSREGAADVGEPDFAPRLILELGGHSD